MKRRQLQSLTTAVLMALGDKRDFEKLKPMTTKVADQIEVSTDPPQDGDLN